MYQLWQKYSLVMMVLGLAMAMGAAVRPRLSLVDWDSYNLREPEGPGTYAFGYDVQDPATNNVQFRNEERHPNGTVVGSYGYVDPDGTVRIVNYVADHLGYRATEENGPKLQMLRPIRYPDTPFPLQDQRTRPYDQFYNQIVNLPQSDLRDQYYHQDNGYQVFEEPNRYFLAHRQY